MRASSVDEVDAVKVRLLTNIVGTPSHAVGDEIELEARLATIWIREGYAVPTGPETTTIAPPETAMRPPAIPRRAARGPR